MPGDDACPVLFYLRLGVPEIEQHGRTQIVGDGIVLLKFLLKQIAQFGVFLRLKQLPDLLEYGIVLSPDTRSGQCDQAERQHKNQ